MSADVDDSRSGSMLFTTASVGQKWYVRHVGLAFGLMILTIMIDPKQHIPGPGSLPPQYAQAPRHPKSPTVTASR